MVVTTAGALRLLPKIERGLGTQRTTLGTFRGFGTEHARLGTFTSFDTERAKLGTFRGSCTERTRLGTFKKISQILTFSHKKSTYLHRGFFLKVLDGNPKTILPFVILKKKS